MKVGVKVGAPITPVTWQNTRDMAVAAEAAGFDSIWVEDHHYEPNGGPLDAWATLSALAAVTSRVELAPIVASLNFYSSPVILAHRVATIHEISGGRFILGLGAGPPTENRRLGLPIDHPASRFEEKFEVLRRLLAGERFSYEGAYFAAEDIFLNFIHPVEFVPGLPSIGDATPLDIPILTGSSGPRMLSITLPHSAGWGTHWGNEAFFNDPDRFAAFKPTIDAAVAAAGREPGDVWRAAECWIQTSGAVGLPIDISDELVPASGGTEAISDYFHRCQAAGIDHLVVLIDPQTVDAVEELAAALEMFRGR